MNFRNWIPFLKASFSTAYGVALLILPLVSSAASKPSETLEFAPIVLGKGEQRLLKVAGLAKFSLGSEVIRAHTLPSSSAVGGGTERLLLKGVQPGIGDLWVWKQDGSSEHHPVRVEKVSETEVATPLERALSRLQETEVYFAGTAVILRGEIESASEMARVVALARGFPKELLDETTASDSLLIDGEQRLQNWLSKSKYASKLRVERAGNDLWIRGNLENPLEQASLTQSLQAIYPPVHFEVASLPDSAPTIHFRVFLLELKKSRFGAFGLSWPGQVQATIQATTSQIEGLVQLDATLQALEGEGSLKILSKPELVVRAPGEAELFSGGELPIQTQNRYFSNLTWKNYGLTLKLKVTDTTREQVRLDIFTEVSHLDTPSSADQIPGIQANRMKTQVDAKYGVPLLLSGLLQQGTRENAKGLPLLRKIPVLGPLFGSEDYLNERSELVAILLPQVTPPPAPMERFESKLPKGPVPAPRNWLSRAETRRLKEAPTYPWNAFE